MQRFFHRVDTFQYRQEVQGIADHLIANPPLRAAPPPPVRPVGRPPKKRDVNVMLSAAAAADAGECNADEEPDRKRARGPYVRWFNTTHIHEILDAHRRTGGKARRTLTLLRKEAPATARDRYKHLSHSTIASWFDKNNKLTRKHQLELEAGAAQPTGAGYVSPLAAADGAEGRIVEVLQEMRKAGTPLNTRIIRWVMHAILQRGYPEVLDKLQLSQSFISRWVRTHEDLQFRWRARTTTAGSLPDDWETQGMHMAMRIAAAMHLHKVSPSALQQQNFCFTDAKLSLLFLLQVDPSLVFNMDQTGVHLVPAADWTYEKIGSASVAIAGADDKRQITACVAASLRGDMLPLQLIFEGKTPRALPAHTAASLAARIDITHSPNHWSSQETMQRYITHVIMPHTTRMIELHGLDSDAHIVLLLDAWSVHKSKEFREWIAAQHPRIHLVYVPANCTSKLQLCDVALQRPFKHGITTRFNEWAAQVIAAQIDDKQIPNLNQKLTMGELKPLVLQWCCDSWNDLRERKQLILDGWERTVTGLYNVHSMQRRIEAVSAVALQQLVVNVAPEQDEPDGYVDSEPESDAEADELDLSKPVAAGKQSGRARFQTKPFGYQLDSSAIEIVPDELSDS